MYIASSSSLLHMPSRYAVSPPSTRAGAVSGLYHGPTAEVMWQHQTTPCWKRILGIENTYAEYLPRIWTRVDSVVAEHAFPTPPHARQRLKNQNTHHRVWGFTVFNNFTTSILPPKCFYTVCSYKNSNVRIKNENPGRVKFWSPKASFPGLRRQARIISRNCGSKVVCIKISA